MIDMATLDHIQDRVFWLAMRSIYEANLGDHEIKVGGHPASSASMVSLTTALWFGHLGAGDVVSVKPHGAPVLHAIQYLLGIIDEPKLRSLRRLHGLQPYPSRVKDPGPPDFTTGSVGLGSIAPLFSAMATDWVRANLEDVPVGRFITILGDAELDEGSLWEALHEPLVGDLDRVMWIVDINRQSLDRFIPRRNAARMGRMFEAAGWAVIDLPFGSRLDPPAQSSLQNLMETRPELVLPHLSQGAAHLRDQLVAIDPDAFSSTSPTDLYGALVRSGGHDLEALLDAYLRADRIPGPVAILAHTIKGWRLPVVGAQLNHAALLSEQQMAELRSDLGIDNDWDRFSHGSPEARLCMDVAARLGTSPSTPERLAAPLPIVRPSASGTLSTQQALGRFLTRYADDPGIGSRIITASPDVAVSTNLGGWINKVGVFSPSDTFAIDGEVLRWDLGRHGRHIELGISEINLFILLGQLGLQPAGKRLIPIGTLYDPFVLRGLDAFIYSLYAGADFIVVGTPSGITLSYEGGSHQSFATPSVGIELPRLTSYEPAFAADTGWALERAITSVAAPDESGSFYLRLSTRPVPQELLVEALVRLGEDTLREHVIAGGYVLHESTIDGPPVVVFVAGPPVVEVLRAARELENDEGIQVHVIAVTSTDLLFHEWQNSTAATDDERFPESPSHLATLVPPRLRGAPILTVHDASPHAMGWLGSVFGAKVYPLGPVTFGEAGSIADLYDEHRLSVAVIVNAVIGALGGIT
jgi:pyruvate dehydrogenase E1 component